MADSISEYESEFLGVLRTAAAGTTVTIHVEAGGRVTVGGTFPQMAEDQGMSSDTPFLGRGDTFDEAWFDMVPEALRTASDAQTVEIPAAEVGAALAAWRRQNNEPAQLRVIGKPRLIVVKGGEG